MGLYSTNYAKSPILSQKLLYYALHCVAIVLARKTTVVHPCCTGTANHCTAVLDQKKWNFERLMIPELHVMDLMNLVLKRPCQFPRVSKLDACGPLLH